MPVASASGLVNQTAPANQVRVIHMNKAKFNQIILRNCLLWGWAFLTPPVVMVVLDGFDKHTPNNIALFSTFMLMIPFMFANKLVSTALTPFVTDEESK